MCPFGAELGTSAAKCLTQCTTPPSLSTPRSEVTERHWVTPSALSYTCGEVGGGEWEGGGEETIMWEGTRGEVREDIQTVHGCLSLFTSAE